MSVVLQCPTIDFGGTPAYAHEWTDDAGTHHVALRTHTLTAAVVVSDVADALAFADALQDAARRLRLRELADHRRQVVAS